MPCAVEYGWSPDSRLFVTATTAPRMNVDNGIHVYRYDGSGPLSTTKDRDPLFDCFWLPGVTDDYPDRGVSPASKARMRAAPKPEPAKGAYRPPGARGLKGGGSLASMIRAEREKDKGSSGTVRQPQKPGVRSSRSAPRPRPGPRATRGARRPRRSARRPRPPRRRWRRRSRQGAAAAPGQRRRDHGARRAPQGAENSKKLKQVEELETKVAGGLAVGGAAREARAQGGFWRTGGGGGARRRWCGVEGAVVGGAVLGPEDQRLGGKSDGGRRAPPSRRVRPRPEDRPS